MEQTAQNSLHLQKPITSKEFNERYWFNSLQMVTVINPKVDDYPFMVEMRHFIIRAGATERFPGVIANVYLDQMSKILAQDDDKLAFMADPALMKQYYDKLIVDVENLVPEYNPIPSYLRDVAPSAVGQRQDDTPPWQQNMEQARTVAPQVPSVGLPEANQPAEDQKPPKPQEETREFDLGDTKYKMIVDKNGNKMFFKDGRRTSVDDYQKAASMI